MADFKLGRVVMTAGILEQMNRDGGFQRHVSESFDRYTRKDWGDLCEEDAEMNDLALKNGDDRILAVYEKPEDPGYKIWIITEWDHSATTILFPSEY